MTRNNGADKSAKKHLPLAVLLGLLCMAGAPASGDTLASWDLSGRSTSSTETNINAASTSLALSGNATLVLGSGAAMQAYAKSFVGSNFNKTDPTFSGALSQNEYLELAFETSAGHDVALGSLSYTIRRADKAPDHFKWICITNGATYFTIKDANGNDIEENPTSTAADGTAYTLSLSTIGSLPPSTTVVLRIVPYGSTSDAKTVYFGFRDSITLTGTVTETSGGGGGGDPDPPGPPDPPESNEWLELRSGHPIREDFNSIGGDTTATLPAPWRVAYTNTLNCFTGLGYAFDYGAATTTTQKAHFGSKTTTAGIYNLGAADNAVDRAVGFLSASGSSNKFRTCALMVPLKNATASAISQFNVQFTWEKWRSGKAKMLNLCYSTGAPAWQWVKLDEFHLGYDASGAALIENDETNAWAAGEENMEYRHFSRKVNINIPAGGIVYLGWFYSATDTNSGNAQAWAVDDVKIRLGEDRTVIIMR